MRRVSAEPPRRALFMQRMPARVPSLIVAGLVLLLPACQTLDKAAAELTPYGVQLNERIAQWERACKDMKLGPYYDNNPANRNDASCDFLFLKDKHWDPEADQFSRYAHSIKLPPPHDKPQAIYQAGMSSGEYLKELCAKEAGEWIFRTVSNVEGVLQARTRVPNPRGSSQLMIFAQEPLYSGSADELQWLAMGTTNPFNYAYFEYPEAAGDGSLRIFRFYRNEGRLRQLEPHQQVQWRQYHDRFRVPYVIDSKAKAPYAYVGRGTIRPGLNEHGIRGFELLVVDSRTRRFSGFDVPSCRTRPAPLSLGRLHKDVV